VLRVTESDDDAVTFYGDDGDADDRRSDGVIGGRWSRHRSVWSFIMVMGMPAHGPGPRGWAGTRNPLVNPANTSVN